jgi:predicted secreted protein
MTTFEAQGTQFMRANIGSPSSPDDYTNICVNSIDPIGFARSLIDVTTLCSDAREYRLAIKDGQEINIEAFYDPTNSSHAGLRDDLTNGTIRAFKIVLTDDSPSQEITFDALVMNWSIGASVDNVYPLRVTLKPTGDLVFTS